MARKIAVEIVGDASSLERAFKKSSRGAKEFNKDISKSGKNRKVFGGLKSSAAGMAAGFLSVGAAAQGVKKAIDAAADLNEQVNKSKAVFKGSSGEILKWSKGTARGIGISRTAALEATGTFGNMLVPMGFARGKAADMSKTMVDLAGDMASFNNASPEETLDALRSGLAGEAEPLRKFGVFLSDARLRQEALSQGLKVGSGALDANVKAAATYGLILKDTKDAQGDFAATSGSMSNQQKILAAVFSDLSTKLGTLLLPKITEIITAVTAWISKSENQKLVIDTVKDAVAALTSVLNVLKTAWQILTTVVGGNRNAILLLIAAYAGFKVLSLATKVTKFAGAIRALTGAQRTAAASTSMLATKQGVASGSTGKLTGRAGKLKGAMGKAGVAGAVALAAYGLSDLIRQIPGWDKKMKEFGGTIYYVAKKLGLVNDETAKFEGKAQPKNLQALAKQARNLKARGLTPQQATDRLVRQNPNVSRYEIEGLTGARVVNNFHGPMNFHGITNLPQLEEEFTRRSKRRPHRR